MKLKVLTLDRWMILDELEDFEFEDLNEFGHLVKMDPILNRNGYYYDRETKKCWFEYNGHAYYARYCDFLYDLEQLNHIPLSPKAVAAIEQLRREKICPKNLNDVYYTDRQWKECRAVYRDARLWTMKTLKDID
jgi:hypothetical protein